MSYTELVALGPELCREAVRAGRGVNESHLLVHHVFSDVLREDLLNLSSDELREQLTRRLRERMRCRLS